MSSGVFPLTGTWAIEENTARRALQVLERIDLAAHRNDAAPVTVAGNRVEYTVTEAGTAIIPLEGPLTKRPHSLQEVFGGTSTVLAARAVRQAAQDPNVRSILLAIDSPGGTTAGTADLAGEVRRAAGKKPTWAYASDDCCSAAYWVASQASQIWANETALVGSIGTLLIVEDTSRRAEGQGVTVHVIGTGPYKGAGAEGAPITPEQLAEMQRLVEGVNERFLVAVARGRGLPMAAVRTLADGRIHVGRAAQAVGLIDGVESFEHVLKRLQEEEERRNPMSLWEQLRSALGAETFTEAEKKTPLSRETAAGSSFAPAGAAGTLPEAALLEAALAAGLDTPEKLAALAGRAALGDRYLSDLAASAQSEAIRALGAEAGAKTFAGVKNSSADVLEALRDTWRATADAKFGIGAESGTGAKRRTISPEPGAGVPTAPDEDELKDLRAMTRRVAAKGGTKQR